jgi:hypothetical protein
MARIMDAIGEQLAGSLEMGCRQEPRHEHRQRVHFAEHCTRDRVCA